MATAAKAFGTVLEVEDTPASGTFTVIGGLTNLNWPSLTLDTAETTDMEAASAARTRVPTLMNVGPVSFDLNYDSSDTEQEALQADLVAQTTNLYRITGTDAGAADWRFNAWVTSFEITSERDGIITASVTLTPTGVVTRA